jgi:tripartite-type tricarboxylate transporter receptor subunit TctC
MYALTKNRWRSVALVATIAAALFPHAALAQAWPSKPVRLVVPFPPGGATDIIGRLVGQKMAEVWGQSVLIDNKPGAGTAVGTDAVAKAAPDGYTLGAVITAHVINPSLRRDMPFDTIKDLSGVTQLAQAHLVLMAHPAFEANTVAELIALAKKNPGKYSYATPGSGTSMHLGIELMKSITGIDIVHVPYKGGAPASQDVIGGRVPLFTDVLYSSMPNIKAGKLKILALMSPTRPASYREFPVIAETVPGVSATSIIGIVAPSGTPRDLVRRISADIAAAVRGSDLTRRMADLGMEPVGSKPEEYDALIRSEIEKWAKVVKISGATAD